MVAGLTPDHAGRGLGRPSACGRAACRPGAATGEGVPNRSARDHPLSQPEALRIWGGLFEGLRQLGYVEGQNLVIEGRYSQSRSERLPALAAELVRLKVDVIVAAAHAANAAKGATSTIPIVMANHGDPIGSGLVSSLGRPGGNVTGLSGLVSPLVGKQLQLLKEVMPQLTRVAVLSNPANPNHPLFLREAEVAATVSGARPPTWTRSSRAPSRRPPGGGADEARPDREPEDG